METKEPNLSALVLGLAALGALVFLHRTEAPWTILRIAGVVLALASAAILVVSRIQLGSSFSVQAKAGTLVTSGIYSRIRHPLYVFSTLLLTGIALYLVKLWLLLVIFLILVPIQIYRARKEENILTNAYGEEYARYKASTWF
jgi:protein-S-isoprenylcysteine O-methyltransferase Ste14